MTFKNFDLFKKLSVDHFPQTATGGLFSILAFLVMSLLLVCELNTYLSPEVITETLVDVTREDTIQVNLRLVLPKIPCGMLSLDLQDSTGGHKGDVTGPFRKVQLNASGAVIENKPVDGTLEAVRAAVSRNEFCRLEGNLRVASVPGNFHISFHNQHGLVHQLLFAELRSMRMEHTLEHISFGEDVSELVGVFSPYDNLTVFFPSDNLIYNYDYYIKIIPIQIVDEGTGLRHYSYQYSMNHHHSTTSSVFGAIYFRYDIDSITVRYTLRKQSLTHFLISICAILGGVFAVIGILHSSTQNLIRVVKAA